MTLFWICVKIFFARIIDVTIGTIRQTVMFKGKIVISSTLAFLETMIWFLVAREALTIDIESILIPIFYSLGYATGTLLGSFLARWLVKEEVGVQVVIDAKCDKLVNILRNKGYAVSIIRLLNSDFRKKKVMLFIEIDSKSLRKLERTIIRICPDAFITISDTRKVLNGTIK